MSESKKINHKLFAIKIFLLSLIYPIYYSVNWYAAGLVDQHQLIEFGMEEDFLYCHKWRPEKLNIDHVYSYHIKWTDHSGETDFINIEQFSLINWASYQGYDKILNKLIFLNVNLNPKEDKNTEHSKYMISQIADAEGSMVFSAIEGYIPIVNIEYRTHRPPLIDALYNKKFNSAKTLLAKGAKLEHPLVKQLWLKFSLQKNYDALELLLDHGYDVNSRNKFKRTYNGKTRELEPNTRYLNDSNFHYSYEIRSLKLMKLFLEHGANPNHITNAKVLILLKAYIDKSTEFVELLKDKTKSLSHYDYHGRSLMTVAIERNDLEMLDYLIKRKVELNPKAVKLTPIDQAIKFDRLEMLKLLLKHGAKFNATRYKQIDSNSQTGLFLLKNGYLTPSNS